MDSNYSTNILGNKTDVVCARVGGANTTLYLNSAVHFAKQKTYNYFLLLQNMNSIGENERVQKPARIPPQTPPAGGNTAEAGRIHIPSQMFRPAESIQISSSGFSAKYIRTLSNKYRQFWKFVFETEMGSRLWRDTNVFPPQNPDSARIRHAPRGSSFANTKTI